MAETLNSIQPQLQEGALLNIVTGLSGSVAAFGLLTNEPSHNLLIEGISITAIILGLSSAVVGLQKASYNRTVKTSLLKQGNNLLVR